MVLELRRVTKSFRSGHGDVVAVKDISFSVDEGETLAVIGESGAGKSTVGRLVLGLLRPDSGEVEFEGRDMSRLAPSELRRARARLAAVFQEPYESLDPSMKIEKIVEEPLVIHERALDRRARKDRVAEAMSRVKLEESIRDRFPSELSGGQQQRVSIARAIVTRPRLIVLDEPTSSLDVSVRAQVLSVLEALQAELRVAYLFISHDIMTVQYMSRRVVVMREGEIVESGSTSSVIDSPEHPYTILLLSAMPAFHWSDERSVVEPGESSLGLPF